MLRFPEARRVPPPDLSETGAPASGAQAAPGVRALVHSLAAVARAGGPPRSWRRPAARRPPRTLAFTERVPPPGSAEPAAAAQPVRAIVHPAAHDPAPARAGRFYPEPRSRRSPHSLAFPAPLVRAAPQLA
jgi:hypothetical protein